MNMLTTDPNDPALGHGSDDKPVPMNQKYLVLSDEELAKGFVRPVRQKYIHVGLEKPKNTRPLTPEEHERYDQYKYVCFEPSEDKDSAVLGRYWTQAELDNKGCGVETYMGLKLSETYARDPHFYGSTYCVGCSMHRPVAEFRWSADGTVVGS